MIDIISPEMITAVVAAIGGREIIAHFARNREKIRSDAADARQREIDAMAAEVEIDAKRDDRHIAHLYAEIKRLTDEVSRLSAEAVSERDDARRREIALREDAKSFSDAYYTATTEVTRLQRELVEVERRHKTCVEEVAELRGLLMNLYRATETPIPDAKKDG